MVHGAGTPQVPSPFGTLILVLFIPHVLTPSKGISDRVRTSPGGPSLPVILLLLLRPLLHQSSLGLMLVSFLGLMFLFLSLGGLLIPFLSFNLVQGGLSNCLFLFVSHSLDPHIPHLQGPLGDSLTPRESTGHFRVRDWRTLAVQPHGDGWRDIHTGTGIRVYPMLFWSHCFGQRDRLALANACFHKFLS